MRKVKCVHFSTQNKKCLYVFLGPKFLMRSGHQRAKLKKGAWQAQSILMRKSSGVGLPTILLCWAAMELGCIGPGDDNPGGLNCFVNISAQPGD